MLVKDHVRFLEKFIPQPTGCWEWVGTKTQFGHGKIKINRKEVLAHRLMFKLVNPNENIEGYVVRHSCDNPGCVNPSHIIKGTQKDNVQDQIQRGRHFSQLQTHCKNGHEYREEITYLNPKTGHRQCLLCKKAARRRFFLATGN